MAAEQRRQAIRDMAEEVRKLMIHLSALELSCCSSCSVYFRHFALLGLRCHSHCFVYLGRFALSFWNTLLRLSGTLCFVYLGHFALSCSNMIQIACLNQMGRLILLVHIVSYATVHLRNVRERAATEGG